MKLLNDWIESGKCFVIAFIDMDRLKYVNDVFGHAEGDRYILRVAELLKEFSPDPVVCRLGGDEFMILAQDLTMRRAESRLEALRSKLTANDYSNEDGTTSYKCSMSFGVVEVTANNKTPASELLSLADEKMYEYKKAHKAERR
jgi:diguanylate cyclase (GGDEF)-like protein